MSNSGSPEAAIQKAGNQQKQNDTQKKPGPQIREVDSPSAPEPFWNE